MSKVQEVLQTISENNINWDNWQDDETGEYMSVPAVLANKISFILETYEKEFEKNEDEEAKDTLEWLRELCWAMTEEQQDKKIIVNINNGCFSSNANDEQLEIRDYDCYDMGETLTDEEGEKYVIREH